MIILVNSYEDKIDERITNRKRKKDRSQRESDFNFVCIH